MQKTIYFLFMMSFLLFLSSETKQSNLLEIPVDIDRDISLPLSEIMDELIIIQPELTDASLINPERIIQILLFEEYVIIAEREKIRIFNKEGKYIRSISSKGQGPGEFTGMINRLTLDEKNRILFVSADNKIICYSFEGKFLRELKSDPKSIPVDLNYINNRLFLIVDQYGRKDEKGLFKHLVMYQLNNELQMIDSCTIRDTYFKIPGLFSNPYQDCILFNNSTVSLYCADNYHIQQNPAVTVLRDTLYRFENNQLVPELKLKFKNNGIKGGNKFIELFNVYRSSRYVFAVYGNNQNNKYYRFCYDTKTMKEYNMLDGYTDEVNKIEKRVNIRPLISNSEYFYYWYTHIKPDDPEEPNPTTYIGKLKK